MVAATVATVNANESREFDAYDAGGNVVVFVERTVTGVAPVTTTTLANGSAFGNAAGLGSLSPVVVQRSTMNFTFAASDVAALLQAGGEVAVAGFASTVTPTWYMTTLRTSVGVVKALNTTSTRWWHVNGNFWVLLYSEPGGAVAVATDIYSTVAEV